MEGLTRERFAGLAMKAMLQGGFKVEPDQVEGIVERATALADAMMGSLGEDKEPVPGKEASMKIISSHLYYLAINDLGVAEFAHPERDKGDIPIVRSGAENEWYCKLSDISSSSTTSRPRAARSERSETSRPTIPRASVGASASLASSCSTTLPRRMIEISSAA